jgi:kinesin family protein C2/C3
MDGARRLPEDADSPGVNQRALTELFETAEARKNADGTLFRISVEMREIYNEQVRDLLRPAREDASWKGGSSGSRNLHSGGASARSSGGPGTTTGASDASDADDEVARVDARDAAHVLAIMSEGIARRASSATALNERSSRSHCVVTVRCVGTDLASGRASNGRLHLVDLAGSERVARSEARGDRLREAQHINKSLSALGDVVSALLEKRAHVPFRNSRLTRLLADSLGGNSRVLMLAHLAPEPASFPETQSTLVFAKRCSQLELGRARANASAPAADAAALHAAVAECRAELDAQKRRALEAEAETERYKAEAEALRCRLERATSRERTPPREREPLSPIAGSNGRAPFGTGPVATTPARTPSAAKRALGRAAATAASSILMRDR